MFSNHSLIYLAARSLSHFCRHIQEVSAYRSKLKPQIVSFQFFHDLLNLIFLGYLQCIVLLVTVTFLFTHAWCLTIMSPRCPLPLNRWVLFCPPNRQFKHTNALWFDVLFIISLKWYFKHTLWYMSSCECQEIYTKPKFTDEVMKK